MQYSKLLELVWLIASREAIAASWNEIQGAHFLMGILKLAEVSPSEFIAQQNIDKNTVQEITGELNKMQQFFKKENINTTLLRREMRTKLGNGNEVYSGGVIHRSEVCKKLFLKAEQFSKKEGKNAIDLIDLFVVFSEEINPDLVRKKEPAPVIKELDHLTVPFDSNEKHYISSPLEPVNNDNPLIVSLSKRISQQSKGIVLFYKELDFFYSQLSVVAKNLREQSQINLNHLVTDRILSEFEFLEILELYSGPEKYFLIFPAVENSREVLFSVQALNRFMEHTSVPTKIIIPVNEKLQSWWYTQCPKCKLFLSPLLCYEASFYKYLSIDKV